MTKSATFAPYNFATRPVQVYPTYWNADTQTFTPLSQVAGHHEVHEVLDSVTLAMEAGVVPRDAWLAYFFGSSDAFQGFMEHLESYDEVFRITDRWWMALARLTNTEDEEMFIHSQDIADRIRERAEESGQL